MDRRTALEWLADQEGHVVLRLVDGTTLEGWVFELAETSLVFASAPSPFHAQATGTDEMAPPPRTIGLSLIAAYMDDDRRWRPLPPA